MSVRTESETVNSFAFLSNAQELQGIFTVVRKHERKDA